MLQYYIVFMAGVFATLLVQEGLPLVARGLRKAWGILVHDIAQLTKGYEPLYRMFFFVCIIGVILAVKFPDHTTIIVAVVGAVTGLFIKVYFEKKKEKKGDKEKDQEPDNE